MIKRCSCALDLTGGTWSSNSIITDIRGFECNFQTFYGEPNDLRASGNGNIEKNYCCGRK